MSGLIRWTGQIALLLAGCFFMFFGIQLLMAAYRLNDPFGFIMTFFASNLIILISGAIVAGFIFRMIKPHKNAEDNNTDSQ